MGLQFLGGAREVGRSVVLVNESLLLTYGAMTGNPPRFAVGSPEPAAIVTTSGMLEHQDSLAVTVP